MEAKYQELRAKMQVIKALYHSRHYTQCAQYGERLLSEFQDNIHPIHLAYLNFYTALSHDTLAREAKLKNRHKSLTQAEHHYTLAIAALTPNEASTSDDEQLSPTASPSSSRTWKRRSSHAGSFDSSTSAASSATTYSSGLDQPISTPKQLASFSSQDLHTPHTRPQMPVYYHFAASTSEFLGMLQMHLHSVQQLKDKTKVPAGVRFAVPSSSPPPLSLASEESMGREWMSGPSTLRTSRLFDCENEQRKEELKRKRRERVWRERFDAESVRRLCGEALSELA